MLNLPQIHRNSSTRPAILLTPANRDQIPASPYSDYYAQNAPSGYRQSYPVQALSNEDQQSLLRASQNPRMMNTGQTQGYYQSPSILTPSREHSFPLVSPAKRMGIDPRYQPDYFVPSYYVPQKSTPQNDNDENNERLLTLIERQTEVIGQINSKILVQESKKLQKEKEDLRLRLRQLELEHELQKKQIDERIQLSYRPPSPKPKPKSKSQVSSPQKEKNGRVLHILSKLILGRDVENFQSQQAQSHRPFDSRKNTDLFGDQLKALYTPRLDGKDYS